MHVFVWLCQTPPRSAIPAEASLSAASFASLLPPIYSFFRILVYDLASFFVGGIVSLATP